LRTKWHIGFKVSDRGTEWIFENFRKGMFEGEDQLQGLKNHDGYKRI
jgi:hypothetical protein